MSVKLLTKHYLEFLSLKGGCTGSSESKFVKMPHCWKSHVVAHMICPSDDKLVLHFKPWYSRMSPLSLLLLLRNFNFNCPIIYHNLGHIGATTCDFQQCGILTSVDLDEPVQPPFRLRNSK